MIWRNKEAEEQISRQNQCQGILDIDLWGDDTSATPAVNRVGASPAAWSFGEKPKVIDAVMTTTG